MRNRFAPIAILIPLALLSACQTAYKRSPVVTPQRMVCTGDVPASVTLYSPEDAKLVFEGKAYDLNRVEAASGIRYGSRSITFWNKGIDAEITRPDGTVAACAYIPKDGL